MFRPLKKFWAPKNFGHRKIFGPKKIQTPNNWIKKFWTPQKFLDIQLYYWWLPIAKVRLLSLSFYTACSLSFYTAWHTALYNMEKDILLLYCNYACDLTVSFRLVYFAFRVPVLHCLKQQITGDFMS